MIHRLAAAALFVFALCVPSAAIAKDNQLYFVAIAEILPGKQEQYDAFISKVTPIWKRHGMVVLSRVRVVDAIVRGDISDRPHDVALLSVESIEQFQVYLADDDYKQIKKIRLNAVERLTIIEGSGDKGKNFPLLQSAPMAAIAMQSFKTTDHNPAFTFNVTLVAPVKGSALGFLKTVKTMNFYPLSFDDNPMDYTAEKAGASLTLIGERFR